jgi:hypothetical protein
VGEGPRRGDAEPEVELGRSERCPTMVGEVEGNDDKQSVGW